jgi:hypothetical protein
MAYNFKNKNLIYIGGQSYHEKDLLEMIQFYENNKPQIQLPPEWNNDVNSQIFKYYPFSRRISKSTYRPNLYYEQQCQLDITFKEFLDYVKDIQPNEFTLLFINYNMDNDMTAELINVKPDNENEIVDLKFYTVHNNKTYIEGYGNTLDDLMPLIVEKYNDFVNLNTIIFYDFHTVKSIYKKRVGCQEYNTHYADDMTIKYLNKIITSIPEIIDINTFKIYYSYLLFLMLDVSKKRQIRNLVNLRYPNMIDDTLQKFKDNYNIHDIINLIKDIYGI